MKNRRGLLKVLAMMLVIGFLISSCSKTDKKLDGTWTGVKDGMNYEYILKNGKYECSYDGIVGEKGTFTTKDGVITWDMKEVHGSIVNLMFGVQVVESKWYSKNEFITAFKTALTTSFGLSDSDINPLLDPLVSPPPYNYTVDDKALVMTYEMYGEKNIDTFTKK